MAYTISEVRDPVDGVAVGRSVSKFRTVVEGLPVGKAIVIGGMRQSDAMSRARAIGLQCNPHRKFTSQKLPDGSVQITRIS